MKTVLQNSYEQVGFLQLTGKSSSLSDVEALFIMSFYNSHALRAQWWAWGREKDILKFKFKFKLSFIVIPLHVGTYSGTKCRASQDHGAT